MLIYTGSGMCLQFVVVVLVLRFVVAMSNRDFKFFLVLVFSI